MGWLEAMRPTLVAIGPWGVTLLMASAILVAFLREGLVSGTTVRRSDERSQAEIARLTQQWEQRIAEAREREEEWRKIAALHDERADVAARQAGELLEALTNLTSRPLAGRGGIRKGGNGDHQR